MQGIGDQRETTPGSSQVGRRVAAGRDKELATLERALVEAEGGRGRTVLIAGEAGIGKTTLAEAFSDRARRSGARVAWGRCWEAGGAPAYWPWTQVLRNALAIPGVKQELDAVRPFVDLVATLVPEVAGPAAVKQVTQTEGDRERFALFDAVSRVVQTIAIAAPLVIVLDDLHASDHASLLLTRFIAHDARSARCVVVAVYRDREMEADPVASQVIGDVARDAEVIRLEGLDPSAIASVLENAGGVPASDALMARLHQITEGNPFYANEIMRLLVQEGQVEARFDLRRRALPVPDSVSDIVLRRVKGLDPQVQALLRAAAVIGREFMVEPLAQAADIDIDKVLPLLATAEAERIVRAVGPGAYAFDHGLIRESLYESLADAERLHLHGKVAAALEDAAGDDPREGLAEIAHHYLRAATKDARLPFLYAIRAGDRALEMFAYEEAVDLFGEAFGLTQVARATATERGELLLKLGESLLRAGKVAEGRERLTEAAEVARSIGAPELLVSAAIAYGYAPGEGGIINQVHVALIEEALEAVGDQDSVERAALMARLGLEHALSPDKAHVARRDRLTADAIAMVRRIGPGPEYPQILRARFSSILGPRRLDECLGVADETLALGLARRDREVQLMGRLRRAAIFFMRGQAAELDAEFREASRLSKELRQPLHASPMAFFETCMNSLRSDITTTLKDADQALQLGPELPNAMGANLLQHVTCRWETDGGGDLEFFIRAVMEQRPGIRRAWTAALSNTLARTGRVEEAKTLIAGVIEDFPNAPLDFTSLGTIHCVVDALRIVRDPRGAQVLYDAALPFRDLHVLQVMLAPVAYYGAAEWDLGTLASLMQQWDKAEDHFDRALIAHAGLGARRQFAWTQAELAEMFIRRDGGPDSRARELLREARRSAEELGLLKLTIFVDGLLKDEPSVELKRRRTGGRASMIREGEYVTITAGDEVLRMRYVKGLEYLAAVLSQPGRELHVLQIATPGAPGKSATGEDLQLGADDAGPLLDPAAKAAYRRRINELNEDIEEARSYNDPIRLERAQEELDLITQQLTSAVGLHGRERKTSSNVERARVNLTKRIKATIDKIAADAPELGRHLEAAVRTGTYLSYSDRIEPTLQWEIDLGPKQGT